MSGLMSLTICLVFLLVAAMKFRKRIRKFIKFRTALSKLPTIDNVALPLIGHTYLLPKDTVGCYRFQSTTIAKRIAETKMKFWLTWVGPFPMLNVVHPDTAEVILRSSKHMTKSFVYQFMHPWLGTGLLTSDGEKWKQRRRLITPTFHFNILQDFLEVMNEQSETLIRKLKSKVKDGEIFDLSKSVTMCALDIICETAMGQTVNAQDNSDSEYVKSIYRMSELIQHRQKSPWLWPDCIFNKVSLGKEQKHHLKILHGFTKDVIRERMKSKDSKEVTKRMAFLDVLIHAKTEDGQSLSVSDIQEEVDTFMFEGHDTTSATMTWCLFLLAKHPDVQRRVQEEIDAVLGDRDHPTMDDLKNLEYLERVTKEALRLYPSVPMIGRVTTEDCQLEDCMIPKGTDIFIPISSVLRHPWVWDDPDKFDPDRFTKENSVGRHPYAYIPFSAGPRNCIGQRFAQMEEKVIISKLLRRYNVKCEDEEEGLDMVGDLILRPLNPLRFSLEVR